MVKGRGHVIGSFVSRSNVKI